MAAVDSKMLCSAFMPAVPTAPGMMTYQTIYG